MKYFVTAAGAALITATSAFADNSNIQVERIGDMPEPFGDRMIRQHPDGVFKLTFEGQNTNGENLECIQIVSTAYTAGHTGLSCNWAQPKGPIGMGN
jgi:hypothetical protein